MKNKIIINNNYHYKTKMGNSIINNKQKMIPYTIKNQIFILDNEYYKNKNVKILLFIKNIKNFFNKLFKKISLKN